MIPVSDLHIRLKNFIEKEKILFLLFSVIVLVFFGGEFRKTGDFYLYHEVAASLFTSDNIYARFYGDNKYFQYYSGPLLALLLYPLSLLPVENAAQLWKLLNVFFLFRSWKLLEKYFEPQALNQQNRNKWTAAVFIGLAFPVYNNFHSLQFTILMLYMILEGLNFIHNENKPFAGGAIIAAGILIKIYPVVLLPYLFYRKQFKAAASVVVMLFVFFAAQSFFMGWEKNYDIYASWLSQINPDSHENALDMQSNKNHGISSFISALFIEGIRHLETDLHVRRHIVNLSPETVLKIIFFTRLFFVAFTFYFLRTLPFRDAKNKQHRIWELSYLLLAVPLLFPQQRAYNFVLLMPAVAYIAYNLILYRERKMKNLRWKIILFSLAILLLNLELILGHFREYYWHYKTLTYSLFFLLITLAALVPEGTDEK